MPPQHQDQIVYDFRGATTEPRGFKAKRKRDIEELQDQANRDAAEFAMAELTSPPPVKRTKHNTLGAGKESGRPWKAAGERASSLKNPLLSSSWETKMQAKREHKQFQAARTEALAVHKEKLAVQRKRHEAAKQRREQNRRKSAVVQKITNHATLRKMMASKKQRKKLMTADHEPAK